MSYATLTDLISRFGENETVQLTDRTGNSAVDAAVVAQALADIDALIDGYLSGRYPVPLSPVPPVLTSYACDLARARLYTDAVPDTIQKRADDAVKFLSLVGQGKLSLGVQPEPTSDNTVMFSAGQKVFGREAL